MARVSNGAAGLEIADHRRATPERLPADPDSRISLCARPFYELARCRDQTALPNSGRTTHALNEQSAAMSAFGTKQTLRG